MGSSHCVDRSFPSFRHYGCHSLSDQVGESTGVNAPRCGCRSPGGTFVAPTRRHRRSLAESALLEHAFSFYVWDASVTTLSLRPGLGFDLAWSHLHEPHLHVNSLAVATVAAAAAAATAGLFCEGSNIFAPERSGGTGTGTGDCDS
uniref:Uncharacterized protein n=1 Tax=Physcomitrium patens TaxID=3218 RepID=A0A2K1INV7_PHYPA|nr:hypothetical protein PHYPA_027254 [Physcomitrium patens]